jgi:hypothetical protein
MLAHIGVPPDRQPPPALVDDLAEVLTRVYVATLVGHLHGSRSSAWLVRFYDTPQGRSLARKAVALPAAAGAALAAELALGCAASSAPAEA